MNKQKINQFKKGVCYLISEQISINTFKLNQNKTYTFIILKIHPLKTMPKYYQNYNKKSLQTISKANYLKDIVIPKTSCQQKNNIAKVLRSVHGQRQQKYYFIQQQQIYSKSHVSPALLLSALKKIYPNNNTSKIDSHSFINTHQIQTSSYLNTTKQFQQLIDIVIMERRSGEVTQSQTSNRSYIKMASSPMSQESEKQHKEYEAYIVHFTYGVSEKQKIKWETFVQKYVIRPTSDQQNQANNKITYSMVYCYTGSGCKSYSFLNFVSSNNSSLGFLHKYFDPVKGNLQRLKKLQGYLFHLALLKSPSESEDSIEEKPSCYSSQPKRQAKIPPECFMQYKNLKERILKNYKRLNSQFTTNDQIRDVQMKVQNVVCRFLIQHSYNFQKAGKQLSQFLVWENGLRKNFILADFKYWIDMDIITKIGQDRVGRPVILFKTYNFFADKCEDVTEYINFIYYFVVVQLMSKCKGHIDEIIFLVDCSNNTLKNLKIEVNKRMILTGLKYCPRMFFKIMFFKCTSVPYYAYTLAKPLLPNYSNQVISMFKQGHQKIFLQECLKWMDIEVIPQSIGGRNYNCKDLSQKNLSTRDQLIEYKEQSLF